MFQLSLETLDFIPGSVNSLSISRFDIVKQTSTNFHNQHIMEQNWTYQGNRVSMYQDVKVPLCVGIKHLTNQLIKEFVG